jgi:NADH:ubiquinone oxidoreductase subunit F (NADH-binding)
LYCVSGHVNQPGVYELPLGVNLDELVTAAGGYEGTPKAFSPGGASSGYLPMKYRDLPLDYKNLADVGSMLGSAGLVVLNDTIDMAQAVKSQLIFFERESGLGNGRRIHLRAGNGCRQAA